MDREPFEGLIWEPACGEGHISEVLIANGHAPVSSDLYDRGYGVPGVDFVNPSGMWQAVRTHNVITNPPFDRGLEEAFIHRALEVAENKVAMFLRLAFQEGVGRAERIFLNPDKRPSRIWVFSERVTLYRNGVQTGGGGTTAYMWMVWDAKDRGKETVTRWLPPGCKSRILPGADD